MFENPSESITVGVVILLGVERLLRLIFGFIKGKNGGDKTPRLDTLENKYLVPMHQQVSELHQWHSVVDEDGVRIWYVRRSLEKAITALANNIDNQTRVMENMLRITARTLEKVEEVQDELR